MAENEMKIIISAEDEASETFRNIKDSSEKAAESIRNAFSTAGQAIENFGRSTRELGKTFQNVGMTMSFFGAAISGPFILAIRNSAEHSTALKIKLDNIKAVFEELQLKIATAVIPILDRFSNIIGQLNNFLNSLNPTLLNTALQVTFLTGIFLTLSGVVIALVGKILVLEGGVLILSGKFLALMGAAAPFLIIAAAVGTLTFAMFKLEAVANTVMSTFQTLFLSLKVGFSGVVIAIEGAITGILNALKWIADFIAATPGPAQAMFKSLSDGISGVTATLKFAIEGHVTDIQTNVNTIGQIFETGTGAWSQSFDKFKEKVEDVKKSITGLGATTAAATKSSNALWKQQAAGVQSALGDMSSALTAAAAENKKFAMAAKIAAIGLAIINTAVGVTNALAVPPPWLGWTLAAITAAAGAIQIATIAATPMAAGGIVTRPMNALIGEAGPEAVIPLNKFGNGQGIGNQVSIHIEINNPMVRSDEDLDSLTEEISLRLARETERL